MKPLTKRLQTALDLLPACHIAADIGCDHGIAAEALLCQHKCQRVLACDISAPSLAKARARLTRAGLAGHAEALYRALPALGLCAADERIVWENGRFFPLVLLVPGRQAPLTGAAAELGPVNCQRRDEGTLRYAAWLCRVLEKTLRVPGASRTAAHQAEAAERLACLRAYLEEEK